MAIKKDVDAGTYNRDQDRYKSLVEELYASYPPITLDATYANFFTNVACMISDY